MAPKVAIIIYSMYHHVATMAESVKKGVEAAGGKADIYQIPETLSEEVLGKMGAPAKPNYPIATLDTLTSYDAFLFGIPLDSATTLPSGRLSGTPPVACGLWVLFTVRLLVFSFPPVPQVVVRKPPLSTPCLCWCTTVSSTCHWATPRHLARSPT